MEGSKQQHLAKLREEFRRWEDFLDGLDEHQITDRILPEGLSVKDVVAHLWSWQQRSVERLEAALADREPDFSGWPGGNDSQPEADVSDFDAANARIYTANRDKPWEQVRTEWRDGYQYFLTLAEQVPEADLITPGRYDWLNGEPLITVLASSYRHYHQDHLEPLLHELAGSNK